MNKTIFLLLFAMWVCNVNSQSSSPEIVATAGESFQGNSIQLDWTLGELAITSIHNSSQQITQGFHQSKYTLSSLNDFPEIVGQIQVYPNPTTDIITMKFSFEQNRDVEILLYDFNGRFICLKELHGKQLEYRKDLSMLTNGSYYLKALINKGKYSKTFKILKTN